jgi:hypothetical protein
MKKIYLLASLLVALTIGTGLILGGMLGTNNTKTNTVSVYDGTKYKATVCVYKNGKLIDCTHNLLTDIGKNFTQQQLINPQSVNKTAWITLSTATGDCSASATKLANELATANLGKASCTLTSINTSSWNCTKTFTATGSVSSVQVAGYNWNATAGANDLFACATFTSVNLENNDQLTISWQVSIS